jgi:hypothetical protein
VHNIYYAPDEQGVTIDSSKAEIWPYSMEESAGGGVVLVPVRRLELTLPADMVLPLARRWNDDGTVLTSRRRGTGKGPIAPATTNSSDNNPSAAPPSVVETAAVSAVKPRECRLWGRLFRCPRRSEAFLTLEYHGEDAWRRPKTIHWGTNNVLPWGIAGDPPNQKR